MALFQYAKKDGTLSEAFEASDSSTALSRLASFSDAATGTGVAAYTPVKGEVSALSSTNGKERFTTDVQPKIDTANKTVLLAAEAKKARDAAAAKAATGVEVIPPDVQAEIDANKSDIQKYDEALKASWDKQAADAKANAEAITLANRDAGRAAISVLTGQWQERRQLLEQSNKANVASWNQQFLRSGQAEYSPGMTGDMITGKEQEGMRKVKVLDDEYNSTVASINAAVESKNYAAAANLSHILAGIEEKALKQMEANAKEAKSANDAIRKNLQQTTREMAISDLVQQYPDASPAELQELLNMNESGGIVGDISLDEISKILKIVSPDASLSGLSADFRTFKFLQDTKDPTVEGMSYLDFTKAVALSKKTSGGSGTGGGYTSQEQRKLRAAGIDANDIEAADDFLYGEGDTGFEMTGSQRSQLLSGGFTFEDVKAMEGDLAQFGIEQVTQGMDKKQSDLVKRVLAGSDSVDDVGEEAEQFLDTSYFEGLFTDDALKTAAKEAGFRGVMTSWGSEKTKYLDYLMDTVEQYRAAGYTDQEILKMMK